MAAEGPGPTAPSRPTAPPYPSSAAQRFAGAAGVVLAGVGIVDFLAAGHPAAAGTHLGAGLLLLAAAAYRGRARAACWLVGTFFAVVFAWGLLDGDRVFGSFPVAAGWLALWAATAVGALGAWARSKDRRDVLARDRVAVVQPEGPQVVGPGSGHVGGPRAREPRIDRRLPQKTHP